MKRLGAATRRTACASSYASGTSGRIHALICWGSSCSRRLTQVCQNSFMSLLFKPRFYPAWGRLSTGRETAAMLGPPNCLTRQRKLAEMMGFSEFCLSEGSRRSQEKPGPRLGRYLQAASLCMLWGEPVAPTVRPPRPSVGLPAALPKHARQQAAIQIPAADLGQEPRRAGPF